MPNSALRPCAYPKCPTLVPSGRCAVHALEQQHQRPNYSQQRWYRTARWKALRRQVLGARPFCLECEAEGHIELATQVDHRIPHRGDPRLFWDRGNLQGLCAMHHTRKTQRGE
jgi:5-methylcytosine-specific restriction enzyme A